MAHPNQQTNANMDNDEDAELGYGCLLVAEDEAGGYEPVALVSAMRGARLFTEDFRLRLADVENGNGSLCPARYTIWVRRSHGYTVLTAMEPE